MNNQNKLNSFPDLIQPKSVEDFHEHYWENEVMHIKREDSQFYNSIFSIVNLDLLLEYNRPRGRSIRVVKNQQAMESYDF